MDEHEWSNQYAIDGLRKAGLTGEAVDVAVVALRNSEAAINKGFEHMQSKIDAVGLSDDEHRVLALSAEIVNLLGGIVGDGPSRSGDLAELAAAVHVVQYKVLGQAAARAYPRLYRLLGEVL